MRGSTIKDVARAAAVSVATVSRVLTGSAPVAEETRARILDAAERLRFTPNASARSLSTRSAATLGVILPDLHGEFFSELLRGLDRVAQRNRRQLLVSSSHHDPGGIATAVQAMHGRADGLVIMAPDVEPEALAAALPPHMPVVLLNCAAAAPTGRPIDALGVDNVGGARAMVEHLAALGHECIAFVGGAARNTDARERREGYRAAMKARGLACPPEYQTRGDFTVEGGARAARALMALERPPTAIFAANDMMALGALVALREDGVRVPEDVAIAGFDDIPVAHYVTPALTTVRVDVDALGGRAAALLLRAIAERRDHEGVREVLPTTLVVRESCGAAARRNPRPAARAAGSVSPDGAPSPARRRRSAASPSKESAR